MALALGDNQDEAYKMSQYYANTSFNLASKLSVKARIKIMDRFMEVMNPGPLDKVLDIGVTSDHSRPESNFFECLYPYKKQLTCVGTEPAGYLRYRYPGITFIQIESGRKLPFPTGYFDIAFSNATIEHTCFQFGLMMEMIRVSKRFFISTPYRWCPMEFHTCLPFIHWLPREIHRKILSVIGLDFWADKNNLRLLGAGDLYSLIYHPNKSEVIEKIKMFGISTNLVMYGKS